MIGIRRSQYMIVQNPVLLCFAYTLVQQRREVVTSSGHGSKISGRQQTKTSLKKWILTVSNFIDPI